MASESTEVMDSRRALPSNDNRSTRAGSWPVELLAEGLALAGRRDEALALIDRLETPDGRPIPGFIAKVYSTLNEPDLAFEWLERAYVERSRLLVYLNTEQAWRPIRGDPRFADLVRRVGIPRR